MSGSTYKVIGMHCASCSANIERTIKKQVGVNTISVNYGTEEAKIDFDTQKTTLENLSKAIEPLGYRFEKPHHEMNESSIL
jgi:Cu+-exporting ATPase